MRYRITRRLPVAALIASCAAPAAHAPAPEQPPTAPYALCAEDEERLDPDACDRRFDAFLRRNIAATARIYASAPENGKAPSGTAVIVSPDGEMVTAAHVVRGASVVYAELRRAGTAREAASVAIRVVPMRVVRIDAGTDIALLRPSLLGDPMPWIAVAEDWVPTAGESLWHFGQTTTLSNGSVIEFPVTVLGVGGLVSIRAIGHLGDSGGPVVAADGTLVGIVLSKNREKGATYFLPASRIADLLRAAHNAPGP